MLDNRLSMPKINEQTDNGKVIRNSYHSLQRDHQDKHYRSKTSLSPDSPKARYAPMNPNVSQYNTVKKPRITIDM